MSDLVERLRETYSPTTHGSVAIKEAADAIERLTAELAEARETIADYENSHREKREPWAYEDGAA